MKWTKLTLLAGVMAMLTAGEALAEKPEGQEARAEEAPRISNYKTVDPALAGASEVTTSSLCPSSGIVAFSVSGMNHVSEGGTTLIGYPDTYTNEGGGWTPGGGTFIAPCAGLYVFSVSFVKDAYNYGGTTGDVAVYVHLNGSYRGGARSGAGAGDRGTGAYTVALVMNAGDYVQTYAYSNGEVTRHLLRYEFTGYLVKPL